MPHREQHRSSSIHRRLDIDGVQFDVEINQGRAIVTGPLPARMMFCSFGGIPISQLGVIDWDTMHMIIGAKVDKYVKDKPELWARWYGEDGVYTQMGLDASR
ncbi:MAG: hypothetical protein JWM90_1110 [Thermoleophilia bacterium]|nr:hypothetical protein [Thermoleophilia bacterium]